MKNLLYITCVFFLLFTIGCKKKYLIEDNTVYEGTVVINNHITIALEGEFKGINKSKENHTYLYSKTLNRTEFELINDSIDIHFYIYYDKKTKKVTGEFYDIINMRYLIDGKKTGNDFALGLFFDDETPPYSDAPFKQIGSIYLTPKN
jgi:hypothetical protein